MQNSGTGFAYTAVFILLYSHFIFRTLKIKMLIISTL
jgi:hypothetical protein